KGRVPAVAERCHALQRARRVAADPDRDVAAGRLRENGDVVEGEELAAELRALVAPARAHHGDGLVRPCPPPIEWRSQQFRVPAADRMALPAIRSPLASSPRRLPG